jgi:hypothetical protein
VIEPARATNDVVSAIELLRTTYNKASKVGTVQRLISFINISWDPRQSDQGNIDSFNLAVSRIIEAPERGGVGSKVKTKDIASAIFLRNLKQAPRHQQLLRALLRDDVSDLAEAQEKLVNEQAADDFEDDVPLEDTSSTAAGRRRRGGGRDRGGGRQRPTGPDRFARDEQEVHAFEEDSRDRCPLCNSTRHRKSECYKEGGGRWKKSHEYQRQQLEKQAKTGVSRQVNREFAKILRDNGYKRHDDADSSDSESSATPSPVKRTRKTRRSKKESGFAFEVLTNGKPESILMFGEHASPAGRPSMTRSSMNGSGRPRAARTLFKTGDHIGHDILPTQLNLEGGTDGEDFIEAIADSGATSHAFRPDDVAKIGFDNVKELPNTVVVDAHGGESRVKQRADLPAIAIDFASGKRGNSMLEDAMVVEKLRKNLLSIPKLVQKRHTVVFAHEEDGGSYIKMRGRTDRIPLQWKRNAWVLRIYAESKKTSAQTKQRTNFLTHRKFAHVGRRTLDLALRRNMLTGFKYHKLPKAEACKCSVCTKAMSKRAPFSKQIAFPPMLL